MRLQLALDMDNIDEALRVLKETCLFVDIIEIGTPLLMSEGKNTIKRIKENYPSIKILYDAKIMDAGEMEADLAFDHGADIVTVLAAADDATIQAVVQSARKHCKEVMADMIAVPDINERALQVDKLGVDYICIHTAVDVYSSNSSVSLHKELATLTDIIDKGKLAVAGGIEPATIKEINAYDPGVVIVGSYITKSQNMAEAIKQVKSIMNSPRINIGVADDLENIIENLVRQIVQSIIKNGVAGND